VPRRCTAPNLGPAIDEYRAEYGRGDLLIRPVTGADQETGALQPDHDAAIVGDLPGGLPVTGFFAAGKLGPVGGQELSPRRYRVQSTVRR
jgi:small ligand-binding sensory domain FIST